MIARVWALLQKHPLYRNSAIFFFGSIVSGFGGYLFQLVLGRMLSVEDFGTFSSLVGFFAFLTLPAGALATITTQVVAEARARGQMGTVHWFLRRASRFFGGIGIVVFVVFAAAAPFMVQFLRLSSSQPYLLYTCTLLFVFLVALWRGVLPGLQRFVSVTMSTAAESFLKLVLAVLFVGFGLGLSGAVLAVLGSLFGTVFILWLQLRDVRGVPAEPTHLPFLRRRFVVILVWTFALTALSSLDIILVKRYFSAEETGLYAAMMLLGRIIFFTTASISGVLFPMSTELYAQGNHDHHRSLVLKAIALIVGIAGIASVVYGLAPELIISLLFGVRYTAYASLLVWFAVLASILSLIQLFATYYLSIQRRLFLGFMLAAPVLQAFLVIRYHATAGEVVASNIIAQGLLVLVFFILFFFEPVDRVPM